MNDIEKYLSPYRPTYNGSNNAYIRNYIRRSGGFMVWELEINCWHHVYIESIQETMMSFQLSKDAKDHLDKALIKKGYIFLTEEQFEKYQLLC